MRQVMVRYKVKPGRAEENEAIADRVVEGPVVTELSPVGSYRS
jgi:hypothetical protein